MKNAFLQRNPTGHFGTFGSLICEGFSCYTAEPPWKNNRPNLSCIPAGVFDAIVIRSPKYGFVYTVCSVPGRSFVLLHSGNLAGDTERGLVTHTLACVLLGTRLGMLQNQIAVLNSKFAVLQFWEYMREQPFKLHISWKGGIPWLGL